MTPDEHDALRRMSPFARWLEAMNPIWYPAPYPGGLPMQQTKAPETTYLDDLFTLSTTAYDTARAAGRTERDAYLVAMGMVAARVKEDIQAELRQDKWHTAATVLDLWAAERQIPLGDGKDHA